MVLAFSFATSFPPLGSCTFSIIVYSGIHVYLKVHTMPSDTTQIAEAERASDALEPSNLPGSMRAVIPHPFGGHVVMTGFPGLETSIDGAPFFDPMSCETTLSGIKQAGARELVVLVEHDELDEVGFELLTATAAQVGLALTYHQIEDFNVPSDETYGWWQGDAARRAEILRGGGTLAYSCQYGAGRSGLMASLALMDAGLSPDDAIAAVRKHFSQAVESRAQEDWLRSRPLSESAG